ncbi:unnamed protein product [Arctogadus glacialis]
MSLFLRDVCLKPLHSALRILHSTTGAEMTQPTAQRYKPGPMFKKISSKPSKVEIVFSLRGTVGSNTAGGVLARECLREEPLGEVRLHSNQSFILAGELLPGRRVVIGSPHKVDPCCYPPPRDCTHSGW